MRKLIAVLMCATMLFGLSFAFGCGDNEDSCEHDYEYVIVTQATCKTKGEMEGICENCGDKIYQHIKKLDHEYVNGACEYCGEEENSQNTDYGMSMDEIFQKAKSYNITSENYEDFLYDLSRAQINQVYYRTDKLYFDITESNKTFSFWWKIEKANRKLNIEDKIASIIIDKDGFGYKLRVLYKTGTIEDIAYFTHYRSEIITIDRLAVNEQNQLFVVLSDDSVKAVGNLSSAPTDLDDSLLVYLKNNTGGYTVLGSVNKEIETLEIPKTHNGKPVTTITCEAFKDNVKLKTVTLGENVIVVGSRCFYGCTSLSSISINKGLTRVLAGAFNGCISLESVSYAGSKAEKDVIKIEYNNEALTNAKWTYKG